MLPEIGSENTPDFCTITRTTPIDSSTSYPRELIDIATSVGEIID